MTPLLALLAIASPGELDLRVGAGFHGLLPTLTLGAATDLGHGWQVGGGYDLAAGLSHDFGLGARVALPEGWSISLYTAHGFYSEEELDGIVLSDAPFGNGLTSTLTALWSFSTKRSTRVGLGAGLTARWFAPQSDLGTTDREAQPTLHHAHAEITADWPGGAFLRVRLLVPVQAELKVIGYLPLVVAGQSWSL